MIIQRYLARLLVMPIAGSIGVLCGPVILIALLNHLPGQALRTSLAWTAVLGIIPTALSLTLPLAVGLGATWAYATLRSDSALHVLYTMRLSVLTLCRPVLLVGLPMLALGFMLSCVWAPRSVTMIQDIMFLIRNNLTIALFNPQTFYSMDGGRYTLFFDRKMTDEVVGGVVFQETLRSGATNLIVAREARIQQRDGEQNIVFAEGTMQSAGPGGEDMRTTTFDEMARPFGKDGSSDIPQRNWRGLFEMDTPEFLAARRASLDNVRTRRAWLTEAIKRFGVPWLALAHPLAGIAIVLGWRGAVRRTVSPQLFCAPVLVLHLVILFGVESVNYFGAWMAWLASAAILAELALPLGFLLRMQRRVL